MNNPPPSSADAPLLQRLIMLEKRVRACEDKHELTFVMVNETNALTPYRQAALWAGNVKTSHTNSVPNKVRGEIVALSGLAIPSENSAFNVWLSGLLTRHSTGENAAEPCMLTVMQGTEDQRMWEEYLPEKALWIPLPLHAQPGSGSDNGEPAKKNPLQAGLVLWREEGWTPQEIAALAILGETYAHAWRALGGGPRSWFGEGGWKGFAERLRSKRLRLTILLLIVVLMFFPVRQSVLAQAEIVPRNPFTVRAPLRGVVKRIMVQPNETVKQGNILVLLDAEDIKGKLESARQTLAVADAELRQRQQQALFDEKSKAVLGILQSQRDQAASDAAYLQSMLKRTEIRADRAGVAVFDDPQEWSGRPVALGERIMVIADPLDVELEAHLPLGDAIALSPGSEVRLFMNAEPASPVEATLSRVGYRAIPVADGTLAYRARATFASRPDSASSRLRVGLKGTAKLYGKRTFLAVYLFRKPLTMLRLWLGI